MKSTKPIKTWNKQHRYRSRWIWKTKKSILPKN